MAGLRAVDAVYLEASAAVVAFGGANLPAVARGDFLDDGEAEPGAFLGGAEAALEDLLAVGLGDAGPVVGDLENGFYVADDGPGIPEADREKVFESGFSTSEEGTGFGLAIVNEIVAGHGWEIRATESEAGGARFEITGVDRP